MKIAVLTSGRLPVPAVLGGAVENLIDFYLEYNDMHHLHDITVYSIKSDKITNPDTACNHYFYVDVKSVFVKVIRKIYSVSYKSAYYDSEIEYFLYRSLQHIKRQHYDCIILENRPGYAMAVKKVTDARIILHLHNDLLNKDTYMANEIYSCLSKVITVSNYIKSRVETLGHMIPVETVYNGIDLDRFKPNHKSTSITREALNFKKDDFVVVYSGRLTKEKGIKELLQAFLLLKDYPSIKLLVVGGSFYGDRKNQTPFMLDLQEIADQMPGKIYFMGFVNYNELPCYLRLADIAVVPSIWEEPFALTCVEAMAVGLPIIATNSGGIPESCSGCAVIIDKSCNVISKLKDSILQLYHDRSKCRNMQVYGIQKSHVYNNKTRYADDFIDVLL